MSTRNLMWGMVALGLLLLNQAGARAPDDIRYGPEYQRCAQGRTADIVECVGRLTKTWDRRLNYIMNIMVIMTIFSLIL